MTTTWCPACYQNSAPEAPTITVNETTITMDGALLKWYNDYYVSSTPAVAFVCSGYDSASNTIKLSHFPVSNEAVQLSLNSGVQGEDATGSLHNFTVNGDIVTLHFTPDKADVLHFHYMAYQTTADSGTEPVGTMRGYAGTTAPSGWVFMDGATVLTIASYPALYAFATAAGLVLAAGPTSFTLRSRQSEYYDALASATVYIATIIKA